MRLAVTDVDDSLAVDEDSHRHVELHHGGVLEVFLGGFARGPANGKGGPELAVEVLSPGNRASHIERKLKLYFAEGSEEVWVVDPSSRSVVVYSHGRDGVLDPPVTLLLSQML